MVAASELIYDTGADADEMAAAIFGDGVTIVSASTGDSDWRSSAIYYGGDSIAPGATPGDTGVILSTGRATRYTNSSGQANQQTGQTSSSSGENNLSDFNSAAGTNTYDASYLDVTFVPVGNTMTMQFIFASEEYPEYVSSLYQDFVGIWVNGSQVSMSVGNGDTDPGNINSGNNQNLFLDNTNDAYNTEMDGLTVTMTLTMNVNAGVENTIRIGIADVADSSLDSNLLIAAGSVQTSVIANDDSIVMGATDSQTLDVTANDTNTGGFLTITHINGQAVTAGSIVGLNTGQTVQLNADGTITVVGNGDGEDYNFTYTISNGTNTDTGLVSVSAVPCFVVGTMIRTPDGDRAVETLEPGDLVETADNGPQPLRWIGKRTVAGTGELAPIRILENTFGQHRTLNVSPQHRVLICDTMAELLFGEPEVLVSAKHLLNDLTVRQIQMPQVTYVHMMFDQHELVYSENIVTESFLPGPQTTSLWEKPIVDEICAIFPELNPMSGSGYSPAARRTLRGYEAQVLLAPLQGVA